MNISSASETIYKLLSNPGLNSTPLRARGTAKIIRIEIKEIPNEIGS